MMAEEVVDVVVAESEVEVDIDAVVVESQRLLGRAAHMHTVDMDSPGRMTGYREEAKAARATQSKRWVARQLA